LGAKSIELGDLPPTSPPIDSLKISACGRYVVANQKHGPTVFQIPEFSCEAHFEQNCVQRSLRSADPDKLSNALSIIGDINVSCFDLSKGQILDTGCIINSKDGVVSSIVDIRSGDVPALRLVSNTEWLESQSIDLISLPDSFQIKHTAPVIFVPNHQDACLKIIHNSTSHPEYSLTERDDGVVLALIEHDTKSLKVSTSKYQSIMGTKVADEKSQDTDIPSLLPEFRYAMLRSVKLGTILIVTTGARTYHRWIPLPKLTAMSVEWNLPMRFRQ
jgi:hypothetical protein